MAERRNNRRSENHRQPDARRDGAKPRKSQAVTVVTYLILALFLCMMAYFVYFMAVKSESFINSPYNSLQDLFSEHVVRGDIVSSDGYVLATTNVDADGNETRDYPYGRMFAHVVGYSVNGKAGLESQANFSLLRSHEFFLKQILDDLQDAKNQGDTVVTTVDYVIQQRAYDALGDSQGAVIVMEPSTGKIIAMVSKPDYDPNTVAENWETINAEGSTVLFNRATQGQYAPGSVFKIFTLLEYYRENGESACENYSFDCDGDFSYDGETIHCASNKAHGAESLRDSFANSCNSSFANLSLTLDRDSFSQLCDDMLFNSSLPVAFASGTSSFSLTDADDTGILMQTAIGQGRTMVSPLHMAMIVSAIDNGGVLMTPSLIDHIENADGVTVSATNPSAYGELMTETEAKFLSDYMRSVVTSGTATAMDGQSYTVYAKTGTAQVSDTSSETNAWFVAFASKAGYEDIAIAVVVEGGSSGSSAALPVAKRVFDLYFNR
ncbi:MAG: penicillin-binding protein 2 [Clostridiales bacterium]|nr:penicillin-binding protein 2 [Clostridiales bacterium]